MDAKEKQMIAAIWDAVHKGDFMFAREIYNFLLKIK